MNLYPQAAKADTRPDENPRRSKMFGRLQYVAAAVAAAGASVRPRLVWQTADGRFDHAELPYDRPLVVGRDPGADVHGGSARLSRRHFEIQPGDAGFELGDLGSLNGTRVNGSRVTRRILRDGDWIEAGRLIFVYLADGPS